MFGIKGIGSVDKPRKFNYIPRYYNPDKEEWEKKKELYKTRGLDYGDGMEYEPGILVKRKRFHSVLDSEKKSKQDKMTVVIRLVSFSMLVVIFYLIFIFFF